MKALLTRLANMRTDLNIWLERLSNWQFVAAMGGILVLAFVVEGSIFLLVDGHLSVRPFVPAAVLDSVVFTSFIAWKRWK